MSRDLGLRQSVMQFTLPAGIQQGIVMQKGKGFDRLRLAAMVATASASLFGAARTARAGTSATVNAGGANWRVFNSGQGPGTAPFLPAGCTPTRFERDKDSGGGNAPAGTGNGCAMNIRDAAIGQQSDAYDGVFLLAVNGTQYRDPDGAFTVAGTTVSGGPVTLSGLTVTADYFFATTAPVARGIYSFANASGAPVTITATLGYNVGSDGGTRVEGTSDGDLLVETNDGWQVTSDLGGGGVAPQGNSDPVVTLARFGAGGASAVTSSTVVLGGGEEDQIDNYTVTIPANSTRRLMVFSRIDPTPGPALAAAPQFTSLATLNSAGLLAGLTPAQQAEIVNWSPAGPAGGGTTFFANVPTLGDWGRYLMVLALGGLAFVATRRLRNSR